jgi:glycosyltransferase involved in cell wall biosynthesis
VAAEANNTVVFVGRLSAEKGGILLAKAARIAGVNVVFVGDGPDREAIAAVNPDAQCTGWLDKPGVTAYLRSARCLVVPSLWYETLGLVVLEAAALGVPAIVPRGTAVCDLVDEGRTGLAFERGNADDLASQLHTFADDAFVRNLSNNAYENFWLKPPTMSVHVEGLLTTYSNVISAALDRKTTAA